MPVQPFRVGDALLLQRLRRTATELNMEQALLEPYPVVRTALGSALPWGGNGRFTYMLQQADNGLARAGFAQILQRPGRPEADVIRLAPSLDSPHGHPAIWRKLLVHASQELVTHRILRLYSDPLDQPLLIDTFRQAGFSPYARETIWRLGVAPQVQPSPPGIRPQQPEDEWQLRRLYARLTPPPVQQAEGMGAEQNGSQQKVPPPILAWPFPGQLQGFVLEEEGEIRGCVQLIQARRGSWLRLWADTLQPEPEVARQLLAHGLALFAQQARHRHLYTSVREYQGGLASLLSQQGFAPVTDRVKMVKHILQPVREQAGKRLSALEAVRDAVPSSLAVPKATTKLARKRLGDPMAG